MNSSPDNFLRTIRLTVMVSVMVVLFLTGVTVLLTRTELLKDHPPEKDTNSVSQELWQAPDPATIPGDEAGEQIRYGKELIAHTARYLGPKGTVMQISNGMNCQNCHLNAGTKSFGNNYGSVASTYPRFRERSGSMESIEKRVNDCFERSLNGEGLDSLSKEMRAIVAYVKWVGKDVPKGQKAKGSGLFDISYLERAADTLKGRELFESKCVACHGKNGEGVMRFDGSDYIYPPLWGEHGFNTGAGLYRLSNFTKYVFANMPLGASYDSPLLTQEEAWDIAAFVVSRPRPKKIVTQDWPKSETKPVDHPFGPYADSFSETQHKFGPFKPILASRK